MWHTRKYNVRLIRTIKDPVTDLRRIIQELASNFNYRDEAAVSFGGEDSKVNHYMSTESTDNP